MNIKTLLTVGALVGWAILSMWWWRTSVLCPCNNSPSIAATVPTTPEPTVSLPYYFTGRNGKLISVSANYPGYLDSLRNAFADSSRMLAKGFWYSNEDTSGVGDLGLIRAAQLRDSLSNYFDRSRIDLASVFVNINNSDSIFRGAIIEKLIKPKMSSDSTTSVLSDGKLIVYFPSNSTKNTFDQQTEKNIRSIVELMKSDGKQLLITGHTDSEGDSERNKLLGLNRANRLREILVKRGVDPQRIKTVSAGEDQPIASNETALGRAGNRRAEVTIQ